MVDELISRLSGEFIQLDLRWFSGCARGAYSSDGERIVLMKAAHSEFRESRDMREHLT